MIKTLTYFGVTFLILISLFGCAETQIDNDIRVLVKGTIVNQSNEAVADAHIQVYTDADALGAERALLGEGFSNETGNFNVTSLFGPNALFYVEISVDNLYNTYRYETSTEEFTPNNLTFDLQTVELA
ncbi:hypothetical protein [Winogradskyella sp. PG-2]|uniref:hypothetical protein n=1 Tax=Winogradskyella sp. PG-2 TaxID=754409 RepID=UPI0004587C52|nr:hypothetical protein [Winogradskyella sp. PG-2]BAO76994.1 hypothetical protein WPG_2764 [Winogradskyella sp. PG-2]